MKRALVAAVAALAAITAVSPAVAAPSRASAHPKITTYSVSHAGISFHGGSVTVKAHVSGAVSCGLAVSPRIKTKQPRLCTSGHFSEIVKLPANHTNYEAAYHFVLLAINGSTTTSSSRTVLVHPKAAAIESLTISPTALPRAGGTTTVTAKVVRASTCTVSVSPAVPGTPSTFGCVGAHRTVSKHVTFPANPNPANASYTVTFTAHGSGGSASKTGSVTVAAARPGRLHFDNGMLIDPGADPASPVPGGIESLSCATATFCVGVDPDGTAVVHDASGWSRPKQIDSPDNQLAAVSCPTSTFCLAVDRTGHSFSYDGTAWSGATTAENVTAGAGPTVVSCSSPTSCEAIDGNDSWLHYDGTSWTVHYAIDNPNSGRNVVTGLSCAKADGSCAAVTNGGDASRFDGTAWGPASQLESTSIDDFAVSCPTASYCLAVDSAGHASAYDGAAAVPSWAARANPPTGTPTDVSCVSATDCVVLLTTSTNVKSSVFDGAAWSAAVSLDASHPQPVAGVLSCTTSTFCAAGDSAGRGFVYNGATWSEQADVDPVGGDLGDVSCVASGFCVAVDGHGNALTYDGSTWSARTPVAGGKPLLDVSCASDSLCLAIDGTSSYMWNGTTWSGPAAIESGGSTTFRAISCTSSSFCDAVGDHGAQQWTGSWPASAAQVVDASASLSDVSCVADAACVAIDSGGNYLLLGADGGAGSGTDWSAPTAIPGVAGGTPTSLSCLANSSHSFCVAVGHGAAYRFLDTTWAAITPPEGSPGEVSCPAFGYCVAVDAAHGNVIEYNLFTGGWSTPPLHVDSHAAPGAPAGTLDDLVHISCSTIDSCEATALSGYAFSGTSA